VFDVGGAFIYGSGKAAGEEDWREKEDQMSKGDEVEQFDE